FETLNGGITWQNISAATSGFPDLPSYSITQENLYNGLDNKLFVCTDAGIYVSTDDGKHWAQPSDQMPNAQVVTLVYNAQYNILLAGTHGRGAFEIEGDNLLNIVPATNLTAVEGNVAHFGSLATFTDTGGADPVGNYTATVNWGDGNITGATITKGLGNSYT